MKKLKLDLDQLSVESFGTSPARLAQAGTVQGNEDSTPVTVAQATEIYSWVLSCNLTCAPANGVCVRIETRASEVNAEEAEFG
ncbi:MAG TPA: hypothetical protein VFR81_23015 [Longimicrobium sp.]|nr:hypothetical protein [Longimicrobium sp.]